MPKQTRPSYRLRIRTTLGDWGYRWIIGHRLYSLAGANRRAEALRRQGHVVHVDSADWHARHGTI